jgi:hypothetical protein
MKNTGRPAIMWSEGFGSKVITGIVEWQNPLSLPFAKGENSLSSPLNPPSSPLNLRGEERGVTKVGLRGIYQKFTMVFCYKEGSSRLNNNDLFRGKIGINDRDD